MKYNPFSLEGKTIFVTGASSGIGRCVALECSKLGATMMIAGRNEDRLNETAMSLEGFGHRIFIGDITNEVQTINVVSKLPCVDGVVISAGINDKSLIKQLNHKKIEKMLETNFVGPLLMTKEMLKQKKIKFGGSIVLISSISSTYSTIANTMYACSKGAVESFVRVGALELSHRKIRVNAIRPGVVDTPILDNYALRENLNDFIEQIPLGRIAKPEDVAYGVIYLISDASSWITGTTITIDGGITLR